MVFWTIPKAKRKALRKLQGNIEQNLEELLGHQEKNCTNTPLRLFLPPFY